jgi:hypothetical protein
MIKIGTIQGPSCLSIGNNFIEDFKNSKKHNQGLGNIHGDRNNLAHMTASLTNHEKESKGNLESQKDESKKTLD